MVEELTHSQEPEYILAGTGEPFKTARAAQSAITNKNLDPDEYGVVELSSKAFVIRKVPEQAPTLSAGQPSEEAGVDHLKPDAKYHEPKIRKKIVDGIEVEEPYTPNATYTETYHEVRFHERSNPNDTEDVVLGVNGERLQIQRNVKVITPRRHLEAAHHTTREVFRQLPNEDRKVIGHVQTYPYSYIRKATEQEFRDQKGSGDRKNKQVNDQTAA